MRFRVPALDQSDCSICYDYDLNISHLPCLVENVIHNRVHDLIKVLFETLGLLHGPRCPPRFHHWPPAQHTTVKVHNSLNSSKIGLH